jgi:hypothetical protein
VGSRHYGWHRPGGWDRPDEIRRLVTVLNRFNRWLAWRRTVLVLSISGIGVGWFDSRCAVAGALIAMVALLIDARFGRILSLSSSRLQEWSAPSPREMMDWFVCHELACRVRIRSGRIGESLESVLRVLRAGIADGISAGWRPQDDSALRMLRQACCRGVSDYCGRPDDPSELVEFLIATILVENTESSTEVSASLRTLASVARTERLRVVAAGQGRNCQSGHPVRCDVP